MSRVDTASGLGGGKLTEDAPPSGQPQTATPAPNSGTLHEKRDHIDNDSGKAGPDGKGSGQQEG